MWAMVSECGLKQLLRWVAAVLKGRKKAVAVLFGRMRPIAVNENAACSSRLIDDFCTLLWMDTSSVIAMSML